MAKNKKTVKEVLVGKKATIKPAAETKEKTPAVEKPAQKEEKSEEKPVDTEAPKAEETKKGESSKKEKPSEEPKVIIPEEVKPEEKKPEKPKEETKTEDLSISRGLYKAAGGVRMDPNRAVDLMKMIREDYIVNPDADKEIPQLTAAMTNQYGMMKLLAIMQYNAQVEEDFQTLGVKATLPQFQEMEAIARQTLGIQLKALPVQGNDKQLIIDFSNSNIPADVKEDAKKDAKAAKLEIPEPDEKLPEADKLAALRTIFSQHNGIGNNLNTAIEWARKAFSFEATERKSVILANIVDKGAGSSMINCLRGMTLGKLNAEHSLLGAHAILKTWCPSYSDEEIADIMQVLSTMAIEKRVNDWNEKASPDKKTTLEGELAAVHRQILAGSAESVINAILNKKESAITKIKEDSLEIAINTASIRKSLVSAYGDSDNLLKDKLKEITQYYAKPIMRLSNYVDKSAYAKKQFQSMKRLNLLLTLFVLSMGAYLGYNSKAPSQSLMASETPMIRWVDVPKQQVGLELNISLNKDSVCISGNAENATVTVTKEEVTPQPKYIIREVEKPVYIATANTLSNKLLDKFCPLSKPVKHW